MLEWCESYSICKVLVEIVVTMATLCHTNTKILCSTYIPQGHKVYQIWFKLLWNCERSSLHMILKKICSYHGNALPSINTKRVLHNYTSRSSYILNLTLIAWMMWKLFDLQDFGKIVVTMATLCLTNTKIICSTSIPQGHKVYQIWFELL